MKHKFKLGDKIKLKQNISKRKYNIEKKKLKVFTECRIWNYDEFIHWKFNHKYFDKISIIDKIEDELLFSKDFLFYPFQIKKIINLSDKIKTLKKLRK